MKKNISIVATSLALGLSLLPMSAFAVDIGASANITVKSGDGSKIIARSDTQITARIDALNKLLARVNELKNVSANEKASLATAVNSNISGLTSLKAKIDGETDVTTLLSDEKLILGSFRIFALVIPQGYIEAAGDRIDTIADLMTIVSGKLQARIDEAKAAGKDTISLETSLSDMNTQIANSQAESKLAVDGVASLSPDGGDKTKADANHTALVTARGHIKTGTTDLKAARADAMKILQAIKAFNLRANASATTSTSASTN